MNRKIYIKEIKITLSTFLTIDIRKRGRERSDGWMYRGWMNVEINECAGETMGEA